MPARRQKPPERLQGRGSRYAGGSSLTLLPPDSARQVPACPRGVTPTARAFYRAFCADPVSQLVSEAAWPKVLRLVTLLARREVVEGKVWDAPTIAGSMGQPAINPLLSLQKELSREIEKLEAGLGILPQDRMRLGIALGQAREATVRGLHAALDGGFRPSEDVIDLDAV